MEETVLIIGASNNKERYSYKAMKLLEEYKHKTVLLHPKLSNVEGRRVFNSLKELQVTPLTIDTVTLYVNSSVSKGMIDDIVRLNPKRVIFNPGTENKELQSALESGGIATEEACTLVMLKTSQF